MQTTGDGSLGLLLEGLTFSYRRSRWPVLSGLTWPVPRARTLLLGPNGAGKSTILKLLAGVERPRSGAIRARSGEGTRDLTVRDLHRRVGYLPQTVAAVASLTVHEQVTYAGWLAGLTTAEARRRADSALARVNLADQHDDRSTSLSGGQLRRLGLAEALACSTPGESDLLLLDEPMVGLDPAERSRLREVLAGLDVPMVVSTHQVEDVAEVFDTVAVLVGGRIVFEGSLADFLARDPSGRAAPDAAYIAVTEAAR